MNQPESQDGISAFFDEELSPSEHREIANHLQQSPAAQNELAEVRQLSEELRSLPPASAPTLLPKVMAQIGQQAGTSSKPRSRAFSKSAWVAGAWIATTAALGLLLAWIPTLWDGTETEHSQPTVAGHAPDSQTREASPRQAENFSEKKPARIDLGSEGEMLAQKHSTRPPARPEALATAADQPEAAAASGNFRFKSDRGRDLADRLPERNESGSTSKPDDPQVAEVLKRADRPDDQVVIVEVTGVDVPQTMKQLQTLLAANQVSPANFELESPPGSPGFGDGQPDAASSAKGLYVQSSSQQIRSALNKLREQQTVSEIRAKTTLALNGIPLLPLTSEESNRRKKAGQMGQSLAQSLREYEAEQRGQAGSAKKSEAQTRKPQKDAAQEKIQPGDSKKSSNEPAPAFSASNLSKLSLPEMKTNQATEVGKAESFQMIVQSPALKRLADPQPKPAAPGESPPPESPLAKDAATVDAETVAAAEASNDAEKPRQRPLRVLFIFREPPKTSNP